MAHPDSRQLSHALEQLVARCAQIVRDVGARHGLAAADVDEVFQEVRIRLWHARPDSEQMSGLPSLYVYRAAISATRDVLRRRRRSAERSYPIEEAPSTNMIATQDPAHDLQHKELLAIVAREVDALPIARRVPVRMHLSGYDRDEISQAMGWTEGKTRNLLYRGLADLRERLTAIGIHIDGAT